MSTEIIIVNIINVGLCSVIWRWPGFLGSLAGAAIYWAIIA